MLGVETGCVHRTLEIERQPLLDARHAGALRQIQEQRDVEDDRRRQDAVAAQKVDLQLHRVAEPPEDVDVVPTFFIVAARRIVIDTDDVAKLFVQIGVEVRLKDVIEDGLLALFFRFEGFGVVEHFSVAVAENVGRIPAFDANQA